MVLFSGKDRGSAHNLLLRHCRGHNDTIALMSLHVTKKLLYFVGEVTSPVVIVGRLGGSLGMNAHVEDTKNALTIIGTKPSSFIALLTRDNEDRDCPCRPWRKEF